jgi:hypothetical protein
MRGALDPFAMYGSAAVPGVRTDAPVADDRGDGTLNPGHPRLRGLRDPSRHATAIFIPDEVIRYRSPKERCSAVSNKSPRQSAAKKPGKSIKEKRLIKKSRKATAENERVAAFLRGEPRAAGK